MLHSVSDKPFMSKVVRSAFWNSGAGLKLSLETVPVEFLSFAHQGWVSNVNEKANDNRGVSVCGDFPEPYLSNNLRSTADPDRA